MKTHNPVIRFPEFTNDWKEKRLNELLAESQKRNYELKYNKNDVLSVSDDVGIVNQIEHLGRSYAGESVHNYPIVEVGDIVYTKSPLRDKPYGIIKINKSKNGIVSTLYAVYKSKNNLCGKFIEYYFQLDDHTNKYLRPLVRKGAKNDMKINNSYVLHDKIFAPDKLEQQKIAAFLTVVDEKIQQLTNKKDLLEQYKKGVMQKIFNQEIRFKDDNGNDFADWELTELKEIADRVTAKNKSNSITKVLTNSATKGIVSQQDYFDKDIANQNNLQGYYITEKDDFVYNPRISTSAPVGPIKRNNLERGLMSPLYSVFRFKKVNLDFIEQFFETRLWHDYLKSIANYGARHDRMNITVEGFFEMPILLPLEPEQEKIASFLSAIDNKIILVNQQLEETRNFKKGLLQQMFI